MFYGVNDYYFLGGGTMTGDQLIVSKELKDMFPGYLNSLKLYDQGAKYKTVLRLYANGEGGFKQYVESYIIDSAQTALNKGTGSVGIQLDND